MPRIIPPWVYAERDGRRVVMLGDVAYPVDTTKPPVFFYRTYLRLRFPTTWADSDGYLAPPRAHPLHPWFAGFEEFLRKFAKRDADADYADLLNANVKSTMILVTDMYTLDGNRSLQDSLIERLIEPRTFQAARHELSVAAVMTRANFRLAFEDESDSSRKHPEFVATHQRSGVKVAVEAKSIHRRGVFGFEGGNPPPSMQEASGHKIAAQVCGQAQKAIAKAGALPMYVFVDLNLPHEVAENIGREWIHECAAILPQIDTGYDVNGVMVGRTINLLAVTNWAMHLGENRKPGTGETIAGFLHPLLDLCRHPQAAGHVAAVKAALEYYGTVEA